MARVKNGAVTKARHKKVLKQAKGYFGSKHRLYKSAKEQLMHSGQYAYRDRKNRKRDFRKLWITRINAACREHEMSYSQFINGLTKANVEVNRKMLSELAISDKEAFANFVKVAKEGLNNPQEKKELTHDEYKVIGSDKKVEKVVKETTKKEVKETKEVKEEKPVKEESKDLSKLTIAQLKEMAKAKKLTGYSTLKKAELVELLQK